MKLGSSEELLQKCVNNGLYVMKKIVSECKETITNVCFYFPEDCNYTIEGFGIYYNNNITNPDGSIKYDRLEYERDLSNNYLDISHFSCPDTMLSPYSLYEFLGGEYDKDEDDEDDEDEEDDDIDDDDIDDDDDIKQLKVIAKQSNGFDDFNNKMNFYYYKWLFGTDKFTDADIENLPNLNIEKVFLQRALAIIKDRAIKEMDTISPDLFLYYISHDGGGHGWLGEKYNEASKNLELSFLEHLQLYKK